jgi:tRNA pseudouridine38-40 synthase
MTLFDEPVGATSAAATPDPTKIRVRMVVAYDGSAYHGFAVNRGVPTVAGTLEDAIGTVVREPVTLTCAGRTDRGVHAWGQVVSLDLPSDTDLGELTRSVNKLCGGSIVVREASVTDPTFDARSSARARVYRYTVLNEPVPNPFLRRTAWWVDRLLDVRAMQLGCDPLIGEHDFSAFCRRPKPKDQPPNGDGVSLVRRVIDARWRVLESEWGRVLRFEIEANAFCHQMVRSIVGTLVEMGHGRKRAGEMTAILRSGDRQRAGQMAPPEGLCLWQVRY